MHKSAEDLLSQESRDDSREILQQKIELAIQHLKEKYKIDNQEYQDLASNFEQLELELVNIITAFGGLEGLSEKRVLDLGSGANFSPDNLVEGRKQFRFFEPWFCRALKELGGHPVAVDFGNLEDEDFEHHRLDLTQTGALDIFPDKSFDGIHSSLLLTSPHLINLLKDRRGQIDRQKEEHFKAELSRQVNRLLKDSGKRFTEFGFERKFSLF